MSPRFIFYFIIILYRCKSILWLIDLAKCVCACVWAMLCKFVCLTKLLLLASCVLY